MGRKVCPVPILDFADKYREFTLGSRKELAEKMTKDWQEEWFKEDLDTLFESKHEPKGSTVAKIYKSLGLKFYDPLDWIPRREDK